MADRELQTEFDALLALLCDHELDAEQQLRFDEILRLHPESQQRYLSYCDLHLLLSLTQGDSFAVPPQVSDHFALDQTSAALPPRNLWRRGIASISRPGAFGVFFASVTCLSLLLFFAQIPIFNSRSSSSTNEASPSRIAGSLIRAENCCWASGSEPQRTLLERQEIELLEGTAEVHFANGAEVLLVGPTRLRLEAANAGRLHMGQVLVKAPHRARGFKVCTANLEIVDLGTEFAVVVDPEQTAAVSVQRGSVRVQSVGLAPATAVRQITAGQSIEVSPLGSFQEVSPGMSQRLAAVRASGGFLNATLEEDADLLVAYGRASLEGAKVVNFAHTGPLFDGRIFGGEAHAVEQRIASQFLLVDKNRHGVAFDVSDELAALSLVMRLRIDPSRENRRTIGLMMSQGWLVDGMVHWQMRGGTELSFRVHGDREHNATLPASALLGRWVHLVLVYDSVRGRVDAYVDAQRVYQAEEQALPFVRIGPATLGCFCNNGDLSNPQRKMRGDLGEFLLFRRALTSREVESLFRGSSSVTSGAVTPTSSVTNSSVGAFDAPPLRAA